MSRSYIAGVLGVGALALALLLFEASAPTIAQVQDVVNPEPSLEACQVLVGKASWYGPGFDGRPTASGVPYNRRALTPAHLTLGAGGARAAWERGTGAQPLHRRSRRPHPRAGLDPGRAPARPPGVLQGGEPP